MRSEYHDYYTAGEYNDYYTQSHEHRNETSLGDQTTPLQRNKVRNLKKNY